jgi:hypothetical protein
VDLGKSQRQVDQRQTDSGLGGESRTDGPKTNWQWTWGRVKNKLEVDMREKSKTGGPKTNWQWTWGRVKDRWTKDKLAVDFGEK